MDNTTVSAHDAALQVSPTRADDVDTVVVDVEALALGSAPTATGSAPTMTVAGTSATTAEASATTAEASATVAEASATTPAASATVAEAAAPLAIVRPVVTPEDVARAADNARRAAATVALAPEALDDEWFGSFDETKPVDDEEFADQPTTTWRRISDWLLRRAA